MQERHESIVAEVTAVVQVADADDEIGRERVVIEGLETGSRHDDRTEFEESES
jgi:hypothetical protein